MFTNELRLVRSGREHIIPLSFRIREEHPEATQMAKSKGPKFYAVAVGRVAGIYNTWDECKAQVRVSPRFAISHARHAWRCQFQLQLGMISSPSPTCISVVCRHRDTVVPSSRVSRRAMKPKRSVPTQDHHRQLPPPLPLHLPAMRWVRTKGRKDLARIKSPLPLDSSRKPRN